MSISTNFSCRFDFGLSAPILLAFVNDTEKYIANVEKWSGVPRNKILTAANGADYIMIVAAMCYMENGKNADISEVKAGFNLQNRITMP